MLYIHIIQNDFIQTNINFLECEFNLHTSGISCIEMLAFGDDFGLPQAPMPPQETGELKMRLASSLEQVEQVRSRSRMGRGLGGGHTLPTF